MWRYSLLLLVGVLCPLAASAQLPAFPGAEGFGAATVGGRGGRTLEVTTLADSGPDSLRAALDATGPRIVVFTVSGTIALQSPIYLNADQSYLTLAGQSAPGCGVQVTQQPITLQPGAHDVIIRHMRFRPGLTNFTAATSGLWNGVDGFGANGATQGAPVWNVILDHVSFEWATDENVDLSYNTSDVTVQWCIMAEGDERHGMGLLIGRYGMGAGQEQRISVHHNLFAHNMGRQPRIGVNVPTKTQEQLVDFRNNIVFNPGGAQGAMEIAHVYGDEVTPVRLDFGPIARVNVVNNVFGAPESYPRTIGYVQGPSRVYLEGNTTPAGPVEWPQAFISGNDSSWSSFASPTDYASGSPFAVAAVGTTPTSDVEKVVLGRVGATVPQRDALDTRIVQDVQSKTARARGINAGSVDPCQGTPPADSDHDGMPDAWERSHGLNPADASDGARPAPSGYSNVEVYLNELGGQDGVLRRPVPQQLRVLSVSQ